jgi:Putative Actinobacterial Holin-X, holin superfamily III
MDVETERLDSEQLRRMSTVELFRHALDEARLLVRAEVLIARQELRDELAAAKVAGILLGAGGVLGLVGLTLLFVAAAVALPLPQWLGALVLGVVILAVAAICAFAGTKRLPKRPLPRTQERVRTDLAVAREQLQ